MSAMRKVATVTLAGQVFDLALGPRGVEPDVAGQRGVLAREGEDLYGRPVALEIDLESELQAIGNVAFVEALLLLLATTLQERDAARVALQKVPTP